ncbi:hypothetical protein PMZ80_001052 [Knufia obscura]|uniref:Uncharacterized protein n=2 Tax=Knufia TaxID=430999 RepID=A0AAN8ICS6_9EURO|nr:hypothetical protein PMZ80_001052 [Knufia obscura]KAK5958881.1 hypothetical protein OHC33_000725 [Knufia fluminis]
MKTTTLTTAALLLATATARPSSSSSPAPAPQKRATDPHSVEILTKIAPTSTTCDGAKYADECITAADATQPLIDSFAKYKVATPPEQAALLSWMAYESADFKYVKNHFPDPGRPGQGTRAMMMPDFVKEYGATLNVNNADLAGMLDDVIKAGGEWGAASWYYTSKCSDEIKEGVKTGGKDGWKKFITDCVETTLDEGENSREAYWTRASEALGIKV